MIPKPSSPSDQPDSDQPGQTASITSIELVIDLTLSQTVVEAVRALPNPTAWLEDVITLAAQQQLLPQASVTMTLQPQRGMPQPVLPSQASQDILPQETDPLPIGSLVRNSLRWLGTVESYDSATGRYLVAFNNGIVREFPRRMLTFIDRAQN